MKLTVAARTRSLRIFLTLMKAILLGIAYTALWTVLWQSSQAFWFLPAGLRFTTFLYTRPLSWPVWIAAEWLGIFYLNEAYASNSDIPGVGFGDIAPSLVYVATIALFLKNKDWVYKAIKTQSEVLSISIAMTFAAIMAAVVLFLLLPNESPFLVFERFSIQGIATYSLGDIAGILFIWSVVEFIRSVRSSGKLERRLLAKDVLLAVVPVLALIISLTVTAPDLGWAVLAILFIPIVYLSLRHGWTGSAFSVAILNLVAGALYFISGNAEALFNTQIFLVSVGITGLFLGAAISQQGELVNNIRKISQRVIETQEYERSRISQDLHDHVGQVLTALRSRIVILRNKEVSDLKHELDSLDELAAGAYQDVHDIVDELSPNELTQFGLRRSLENPGFHQMLQAANIRYHTSFKGQVSEIPEQIQLSIYRIAQEALSNAAKHSRATFCQLNIDVKQKNNRGIIDFRIQDNGNGFDIESRTNGHGIQNIQDRVQALAGTMTINSGTTGTSIAIVIPL